MSAMSDRFMRYALERAVENVRSGRGGPFAALVVADGRIIAEGANVVTSTNDPTAHAEVTAIRAACRALGSFQLTGCDIYTTCEPCPMCLGAIYWARPARVLYAATHKDAAANGFDDSLIYDEFRRPAGERRIPMIRAAGEDFLRPFEEWRAKPDKKEY